MSYEVSYILFYRYLLYWKQRCGCRLPGASYTPLSLDKVAAISLTTFSNAFEFHLRSYIRVQLTIRQRWFRWWLCAEQATSHYLNQCWPFHRLHIWRDELRLGLGYLWVGTSVYIYRYRNITAWDYVQYPCYMTKLNYRMPISYDGILRR